MRGVLPFPLRVVRLTLPLGEIERGQPNVATAAPGDDGHNGGRWRVHALSFDDYDATVAAVDANDSGDLDSISEVHAALDGGVATDGGVIDSFECPVIPQPRNR